MQNSSFVRSLAECRAQVRALQVKLDECSPAGSADPQWRTSGFERPPQGVSAVSSDPLSLDVSLTAIGEAARRLLQDLEQPDNGYRVTDFSGRARRVGA